MALQETNCPDLKLIARGKVRDLYEVDEKHLLFVATDRISAYDVIMSNGIQGKGKILTSISVFWFTKIFHNVPNHFVTADIEKMPPSVQKYADQLQGRCMLVKKAEVLPIEAIVRGCITGSAWSEYKKSKTVCDIPLPDGLEESQKLPKPLFTPSTKAEIGDHDQNIHPSKAAEIIGKANAEKMEQMALQLYEQAAQYAKERGIIIADTKFEFGVDENGNILLIDEVLTPDSSRFWPLREYKVGGSQAR